MANGIALTGSGLTLERLAELSEPGGKITLSKAGWQRLIAARAVVEAAVRDGTPVYGVTTGLGSRATEALPAEALADFSRETIFGRAHAAGPPLPTRLVRAAMAVRLNSFLLGASGVSEPIADHLLNVFNAGLTPVVGSIGSIGAADLLLGATMAEAVMGMGGSLETSAGHRLPAAEALSANGLTPPPLGPRDGLALSNHACFSAAAAALAVADAKAALDTALGVTGLSLLGFQANLGPLSDAATALKPHSGDRAIAQALTDLLAGAIPEPRRLQDPISLRNAFQALGAAHTALDRAVATTELEINAASDNPAVLLPAGEIQSTGNYFTPHLTLDCEALSRALVQCASFAVARIGKLCTERLSGLPQYLADPDVGTNGFAPLLKLAEASLGTLQQKAQPTPVWPSLNADGVEDGLTHSLPAALTLSECIAQFRLLLALEAIVAAQACDMRGVTIPDGLQALYGFVREVSPRVRQSRPLGRDIDELARRL